MKVPDSVRKRKTRIVFAVVLLFLLIPSAIEQAATDLHFKFSAPHSAAKDFSIGGVTQTLLMQQNNAVSENVYPSAPSDPANAAYDPLNNEIYVADNGQGTMYGVNDSENAWTMVSVINASNEQLLSSINTTIAWIGNGYSSCGAQSITVDIANGYIYVGTCSGQVSVIDGATNAVVQVVPYTGSIPGCSFVAYNQYNQYIYVYYSDNGTVSVLNTTDDDVVSSISIQDFGPSCNDYISTPIAVDGVTGEVYVSNGNYGAGYNSSLTVINGTSNSIIYNVSGPTGYEFYAVSTTQGVNNQIFVSDDGYSNGDFGCTNCVLVLNGTNYQPIAFIALPTVASVTYDPANLAVNPENGMVYVATTSVNRQTGNDNGNSGLVFEINPSSDSISGNFTTIGATTELTGGAYGIAVDPANSLVFVCEEYGSDLPSSYDNYVEGYNMIEVVNGTDNNIVRYVSIDLQPSDIVYDQFSGDMYVYDELAGTVSVISGITNQVVDTITVNALAFPLDTILESWPFQYPDMQVNPFNGEIYLTVNEGYALPGSSPNWGDNCSLVVIDPTSNQVVENTQVYSSSTCFASGIAFDPTNDELYVAYYNYNSNPLVFITGGAVAALSALNFQLITQINSNASISGFQQPIRITVDPLNGELYVSNNFNPEGSGVPYITLINSTTNQINGQINLPMYNECISDVCSPDYGSVSGAVTFDQSNGMIYVGILSYLADYLSPIRITPNMLAVIDGYTNEVIGNYSVPESVNYLDLALNPVNGYLYSDSIAESTGTDPQVCGNIPSVTAFCFVITALDPTDLTAQGNVTMGLTNVQAQECYLQCTGLGINPLSGEIYAPNPSPDTISIIGALVTKVPQPTTFELNAVDSDNNPIQGLQVSFENSAGTPIGVGVTNSEGYTSPIYLPSYVSTIYAYVSVAGLLYQVPPPQSFQITSGENNNGTVVLQTIPFGNVAGYVSYQNGTLAQNVTVRATQLVNGQNYVDSAQTNQSGYYNMSLFAGPSTVQAVVTSPFYQTMAHVDIDAASTIDQNLTLVLTGPGTIYVDLYTKYIGGPWISDNTPLEEHIPATVTDPTGQNFNEWNYSSHSMDVTGYVGEQFNVCINGRAIGFPTGCSSVALGSGGNATASIYLEQQGEVEGNLVDATDGQNVSVWTAFVYLVNSTGFKQSVSNDGLSFIGNGSSSFDYSVPGPGVYEFDFIAGSSSCPAIQLYCLLGTYTTTVPEGNIVQAGTLPLAPEGAFADQPGNNMSISPSDAIPGSVETIRVMFQNDGGVEAKNATVLLDVPTNTSVLPGTITLNGVQVTNEFQQGSQIGVTVGNLFGGVSGYITYKLQLSQNFSASFLNPEAFIVYNNQPISNNTFTELLGYANAQVYYVTMNTQNEISSQSTTAFGQAEPGSIVSVFDGSIFLGQVNVTGNGFWTMNLILPTIANESEYSLWAQANTTVGLESTPTTSVLYDSNLPELTDVCLSSSGAHGPSSECYNPQQGPNVFPFQITSSTKPVPVTVSLYFNNPEEVAGATVEFAGVGVENATLNSNGVYTATFPSSYNMGPLDIGYTPLIFQKGNGSLPNTSSPLLFNGLPSIFQNANTTIMSENSTSLSAQMVLTNGVSMLMNESFSSIIYTPTSNDLSIAAEDGFPVYDLNMNLVNTTTVYNITVSYVVPYSALNSSELSYFFSIYGYKGNSILVSIKLAIDPSTDDLQQLQNILSLTDYVDKFRAERDLVDDCILHAMNTDEGYPDLWTHWQQQENIIVAQAQTGLYGSALGVYQYVLGKIPGVSPKFPGLTVGQTMSAELLQAATNNLGQLLSAINRVSQCLPSQNVNLLFDPSGFVYEGLASNPVSGVTASIFYRTSPTSPWTFWDSAPYGEQNPQVTSATGSFDWNVPTDQWMVVYQKPGYETVDSPIFNIPPPVAGLEIGMIPLASPSVEAVSGLANSSGSYIELEFSQYMKASDLNQSTISVTLPDNQTIQGTVTPVNSQESPSGTLLAREALFTPSTPSSLVSGGIYAVDVQSSVENFANNTMSTAFSTEVQIQSALNYKVSASLTTGAIGEGVSGIAQTNDSLSTRVVFSFISPNGTTVSSEIVDMANGQAIAPSFFPAQAGTWIINANFTDGNNVFYSVDSTFNVVQPIPFTLAVESGATNSSGSLEIDTTSSNGLIVEIVNSTAPGGTSETISSFIYSSLPSEVSNITSVVGAVTQGNYYDVALNNTGIGGEAIISIIDNGISHSNDSIYYYYAGTWYEAANVQFNSTTMVISGTIPIYALNGTVLVVGTPPSAITFNETGLPVGTSWSVTFYGSMQSSTGDQIVFQNIPAGSYSWTVSSPISGVTGIRYVATTQSGIMSTTSQMSQSISFTTQYEVTIEVTPSNGGTTNPSGSAWYTAGVVIAIIANPNNGYQFSSWSASTSSISISQSVSPSTSVTINGPGSVTANFASATTSTTTTSSSTLSTCSCSMSSSTSSISTTSTSTQVSTSSSSQSTGFSTTSSSSRSQVSSSTTRSIIEPPPSFTFEILVPVTAAVLVIGGALAALFLRKRRS